MSTLHGAMLKGTYGDAAAYYKGFNPPEGGEQCSGIYIKKGRNGKQQESEDILMEAMPADKLLAEAATKAT
eukprot:11122487-Ditylum_brightwellii.AAC.1